jgi:hypothetical protein
VASWRRHSSPVTFRRREPDGPLGFFLSSRVSGSGETVSSTLVSFSSPSKTHRFERGASRVHRAAWARARCCSTPRRCSSSLGVLKDHPSIDIRSRCPLPAPRPRASTIRRDLRPRTATSSIRSVLVVLPDFDGFLHLGAAGLLRPAADPGIHHVSDGWVASLLVAPRREAWLASQVAGVPAAS